MTSRSTARMVRAMFDEKPYEMQVLIDRKLVLSTQTGGCGAPPLKTARVQKVTLKSVNSESVGHRGMRGVLASRHGISAHRDLLANANVS